MTNVNQKRYTVIDAHCHIYPDKIAQKAANSTGKFYDIPMRYDGTISALLRVGKGLIDHYVVQSVATTPAQVSSINRFIADSVAASSGKMTGLGTLHPDSPTLKEDIDEILSLGLHGVKLHPDIQGFKIDDYRCLKIYELCEGRLPILMHTGDKRYDMSNPNRLAPILEIYKGLTVVGAHFGGYSVWESAELLLPRFPNLYVDCSSCFFAMSDDEIRHYIRVYGAERVLFGTDYPMWDPKVEIDRLLSLRLSDKDYTLIFRKNAERLYGCVLPKELDE